MINRYRFGLVMSLRSGTMTIWIRYSHLGFRKLQCVNLAVMVYYKWGIEQADKYIDELYDKLDNLDKQLIREAPGFWKGSWKAPG